MNASTFTYLLAHPQEITPEQVGELQQIIDRYPFCQSARALQLKGLKSEQSFRYNDALKATAAFTADRDMLFEYITSDSFVQDPIARQIQMQDPDLVGLEVELEDVSAAVSRELNEEITREVRKAEAILDPELFERKDPQPEPPVPIVVPDQPLEFRKEDKHSFSEWLKLSRAKPVKRNKEQTSEGEGGETSGRSKRFELIDKFIQQRPRIELGEVSEKGKNLAKPFTRSPESLMTETLAKVYLQQKNYKKAIQAYKILILKNPEKSGYFADQIRAIEDLIKEKE
jgi:hypothetical protein